MQLMSIQLQNRCRHTTVVGGGTHAEATSSRYIMPEPVLSCMNKMFGLDKLTAE